MNSKYGIYVVGILVPLAGLIYLVMCCYVCRRRFREGSRRRWAAWTGEAQTILRNRRYITRRDLWKFIRERRQNRRDLSAVWRGLRHATHINEKHQFMREEGCEVQLKEDVQAVKLITNVSIFIWHWTVHLHWDCVWAASRSLFLWWRSLLQECVYRHVTMNARSAVIFAAFVRKYDNFIYLVLRTIHYKLSLTKFKYAGKLPTFIKTRNKLYPIDLKVFSPLT